eukprot:7379143-Prymnesium_polylepis.1
MTASGVGTVALKGEDRVWCERIFIGGEAVQVLAVADGHGGALVAQFCRENALRCIAEAAEGDASAESLRAACATAFLRLHHEATAACARDFPGSTLTIVAFNEARNELTCANAGDSAALLVECQAHTTLTADHRLQSSQHECARVLAGGFRVARAMTRDGNVCGPLRAWPGGLAVV